MGSTRVLVTGASGFIAGHCIDELLAHGHTVRGTVRSPAQRADVELVRADLARDEGWAEAVAGCDVVLHVASPFPAAVPRDEDELIRPAVDGTLRVLRAAAASGTVRRVVLTSSVAAVQEGHPDDHVCDESDWSDPARCAPYAKSKTLAERAAWAFAEEHDLELTVINPGFVLGPLQHPHVTTSTETVRRLLVRDMPAVPRLGFVPVDARDLAVAHRLAAESPKAAGRRYICAGEHAWLGDMARMLADEYNPRGYRVPTGTLPRWAMWLAGRFDPTIRLALPFVGRTQRVTAARARDELGWTQRPLRDTVVDTAQSMIDLGLARPRR
jgi:dihydroflavonol-4-reductase